MGARSALMVGVERIRATLRAHRAHQALGLARAADGRAEIHQRLIEIEDVAVGQDGPRDVPEVPFHGVAARVATTDEHAKEHARDVGVEDGGALAEREAHDSSGRVLTYSFERAQRLFVVGKLAVVFGNRFAGDGMEPARADVVAERVPGADDVGFGRLGEGMERGVPDEPFLVLGQHAIDLRLLEHHLGDEDAVRVTGLAPGEVSSVTAVPGQKALPEPLSERWSRQRQALRASRHDAIIGARPTSVPKSAKSVEKNSVPLYTKTGDSGDTRLFDGTKVSKADPRVGAYGEVDELNAWIGLVRANRVPQDLDAMLDQIQRDLFAMGALLADPRHRIAARVEKAKLGADEVTRLEKWIDQLDAGLPALRRFILAGGVPGGAMLHLARTVCRRAERSIVALGADAVDPVAVIYMNRLSDLLFVMARAANARAGAAEIEW